MGWGNCGTDDLGRPIGYNHQAICDHKGCSEKIDRGLSYACGDMHGATECGCDEYFCSKHRSNTVNIDGEYNNVCDSCKDILLKDGDMKLGDDGCIIKNA